MASATDIVSSIYRRLPTYWAKKEQITYIGVPLAILGVLPLIWNLFSSVLIWKRLRGSIPPAARRFFKFTIEPVGGAVTCSYHEAEIIYSEFGPQVEKMEMPLRQTGIETVKEHFLGATWMSFLHVKNLISAGKHNYPHRFRVDLAMDTDFVGLKCDWSTFVYIVLAVGVSAADKGLLQLRRASEGQQAGFGKALELHSETEKEAIMSVEYSTSPIARITAEKITFSLRRALAWELVMVPIPGKGEQLTTVALLESDGSGDDGLLSLPPGLQDNSQREFRTTDPFHTLTTSVTWALYTEQIFHHSDDTQREILPVPQDVLECRRNVADKFQPFSEHLGDRIKALFPDDEETTNQITDMLKDSTTARVDVWTTLQKNVNFKAINAGLGPHLSPSARVSFARDLHAKPADMILFAEVFLTTSVLQDWKGKPWMREFDPSDGRERYVNPTVALFQEGDTSPPSHIFIG